MVNDLNQKLREEKDDLYQELQEARAELLRYEEFRKWIVKSFGYDPMERFL